MKKRKNPERNVLFIVLILIIFSTSFIFSVIYKITENMFVSSYLENLESSVHMLGDSLTSSVEVGLLELQALLGEKNRVPESGDNPSLLRDISERIDSYRVAELVDENGDILERQFSPEIDEELVKEFPDLFLSRDFIPDLFGLNGRLYFFYQGEVVRSDNNLTLNVVSEVDGPSLLSSLTFSPDVLLYVKNNQYFPLYGKSAVEGCISCHLGKKYSGTFPIPHKGYIKGRDLYLSGSVEGHRFVIYPFGRAGLNGSYILFRFDSEEIITPIKKFKRVIVPSWVLLCIVITVGTVALYFRFREEAERPESFDELPEPAPSVPVTSEEQNGFTGDEKDEDVRPQEVGSGITGEREETKESVTRKDRSDEETLSKIKRVNEFLSSVNRITYPERVGETIAWNMINLLPSDLVILAVGEEPGAGGEYEVFSAQKFRKDSVSDIFLQKIKKEFPEYARGVLRAKIIDVEKDTFLARYSFYEHHLKSVLLLPLEIRGVKLGVLAFFRQAQNHFSSFETEFASVIASHLGTVIENAKLHEEVKSNYFNTIRALVTAFEEKSRYRRGHSERVADLALSIGKKAGLSKRRKNILFQAAILHDIGKIGIDSDILNKKETLSEDEIGIIRQHPVIGYRIIEPLNFLREVKACISEHHERYDGTGYPYGLSKDDLTLEGRILAVADAFDAMTSERPYRDTMTDDGAIQELKKNAGVQFDPYVVDLFFDVYREKEGRRTYDQTRGDSS